MDVSLYKGSYDIFLDMLPKTDSGILEIGCGPGNITRYLLDKNPNLKIKGIDIAASMIALAHKNNPSAEFTQMDSRFIDQLIDQYDAILCGFCIPYMSQPDCVQMIADCSALLHESGIFYLSYVEGVYDQSGYITGSSGDRSYFYYHNLDFIQEQLNLNSFEIESVSNKNYKKSDGTEEVHSIILSRKQTKSK